MGGRSLSTPNYRYGFNGKEKDDEVKNISGTQYDYGSRIYDPRLGKFLSIDPLTKSYPWYTPYQFAGNTPIQAKDLDGLEPKYTITEKSSGMEFEKPVFQSISSDVIQSNVASGANFGTPMPYIDDKRSVGQKVDDYYGRHIQGNANDPTTEPFTSVDAQVNVNYTILGTKKEYSAGFHSVSESSMDFIAKKETKMSLSESSLVSAEAKAYFTFNINETSEDNLPTAEPVGQIGPLYIQLNINKSGLQSIELGIRTGEEGPETSLEQTTDCQSNRSEESNSSGESNRSGEESSPQQGNPEH